MSLNNMKSRISFIGGEEQHKRMIESKLKSLKKALLYSYQAATAILPDGREFKCLINPDKLSMELDNKILSIPFKDICLNSNSIEEVDTNIKEGDVIEWKENSSHWIILLQRLEERAYFRADLRRCRNFITLEDGSKYWIYLRGPVEQSILWTQKSNNYFNKLNCSLIMYITKNEDTLNYFHRFNKIEIDGQTWEVQVVDSISTPGLLEVALKESYNNTPEKNIEKAVEESIDIIDIQEQEGIYISGPKNIYPYDVHNYELKNYYGEKGNWKITYMSRKNLAKLSDEYENKIVLTILSGKSGVLKLAYEVNGNILTESEIIVKSL